MIQLRSDLDILHIPTLIFTRGLMSKFDLILDFEALAYSIRELQM